MKKFLIVMIVYFMAVYFGVSVLESDSIAQPVDNKNLNLPPQGPHIKEAKGRNLPPRTTPKENNLVGGEVLVKLEEVFLSGSNSSSLGCALPNLPSLPGIGGEAGVVPGSGEVVPGVSGVIPNRVEKALDRRKVALEALGQQLQQKFKTKILDSSKTLGVLRLKLPDNLSIENAIEMIQTVCGVEFVEPNFRVFLDAHPSSPDDTYWAQGKLWGMEKIGMHDAWDIYQGNNDINDIIVAVIDSGIDYGHPDLDQNLWQDPDDSTFGVNFCELDPESGLPTRNPFDEDGHGTLVAGTIAAEGNNSIGVVGVNWRLKILSLKFSCIPSNSHQENSFNAAKAIDFAMSRYATVINNSYHIEKNDVVWNPQTLHLAVQRSNCENLPIDIPHPQLQEATCQPALMVASAANGYKTIDSASNTIFPANFDVDNVIVVAATDFTDTLWYEACYPADCTSASSAGGCIWPACNTPSTGSNWGQESVDIAAPGGNRYTTVDGEPILIEPQVIANSGSLFIKEAIWSTYPRHIHDGIIASWPSGSPEPPPAADDYYIGQVGTSMAAPHVAGCAALLQGKRKELSLPLLSPTEIKALLMDSGDPIPALNGFIVSGKRLNCLNAFHQMPVCNNNCSDTMPPAAPMNLDVVP